MVGLDGLEPSTSRLSGVRSNRTELQAHLYLYNEEIDPSKLNEQHSMFKACRMQVMPTLPQDVANLVGFLVPL